MKLGNLFRRRPSTCWAPILTYCQAHSKARAAELRRLTQQLEAEIQVAELHEARNANQRREKRTQFRTAYPSTTARK